MNSYTLNSLSRRNSSYQAGDILVACDNVNGLPPGYMGHAAIVINAEEIIESVFTFPCMFRETISNFKRAHPLHAHYRPRNKDLGTGAAQIAIEYLHKYEENIAKGINRPWFSFNPNHPLKDPWSNIYCTKLIWICYYYGADYTLKHEGLLFSPQHLDDVLSKDSHFELLYKHPDFSFKIAI